MTNDNEEIAKKYRKSIAGIDAALDAIGWDGKKPPLWQLSKETWRNLLEERENLRERLRPLVCQCEYCPVLVKKNCEAWKQKEARHGN